MTVPRVLSARLLYGDPVLGYRPCLPADWEVRRTEPLFVLTLLRKAALAGIGDIITVNDPRVLALIARRSARPLRIVPVIPNVAGYVRDAVDYGLVGAGLRRLRQLPPLSLARIGWIGLCRLPQAARKNYATMLRILFEVEWAAFRRYGPRRVFLSPQITDLAAAFDFAEPIRLFLDLMGGTHGLAAGLATHNPVLLLERLDAWGLAVPPLLAPLNRAGYLMQPDPHVWRAAVTERGLAVTADAVGVREPPGPADLGFLAGVGAREMVVDFDWLLDGGSAP